MKQRGNIRLASHNSATGEPIYDKCDFVALFAKPFAQCQAKTLAEQYKAGVRLFDLRVRWHEYAYRCAHGLILYDKTLYGALHDLQKVHNAAQDGTQCYVMVTYEGKLDEIDHEDFIEEVKSVFAYFPQLTLVNVAVKLPTWKTIYTKTRLGNQAAFVCDYPKLIGWKALLPIPWLWKKWQKYTPPNRLFGKFSMRDFV